MPPHLPGQSAMNQATPFLHAADDLNYIERLFVHAIRQWAADRKRWPQVVLEFNRACGPRRASRICDDLARLFAAIGTGARRTIRLHPPVCCHVGHDEIAVLNLLAAHQRGAHAHAEALRVWLLCPCERAGVFTLCDDIARGVFEAGYEFQWRVSRGAEPASPPHVVRAG
jgi:hypothetical protein